MTYNGTVTSMDPLLIEEIEDAPEGYRAYLRYDDCAGDDCPRSWAPNGATFVQRNDRLIDIDDDEAGLGEVRDHFDKYDARPGQYDEWYVENFLKTALASPHDAEYMVRRYLAIFRPEILHYRHYWSFGRESYGWGYVTQENAEALGFDGSLAPEADEDKAREIFDAELETYRQWAEGEIYLVTVVREDNEEEASLGGIYDDWPYEYAKREVVSELVAELED